MAREIGYDLLADLAHKDRPPERRWNDERLHRESLGFGSASQLILFDTNVPSCTLPLFWKLGMYRGRPWKPLFERPQVTK